MPDNAAGMNIGLVDGGNSRLHLGVWNGAEVIGMEACSYPDTTADLKHLLGAYIERNHIISVSACSVSKKWREEVFSVLRDLCGELHVARTASDVHVSVPYDRPDTYGIDRALGVLRAHDLCGGACVVIDAGSAVTVDAVDSRGNVAGGYICAGPRAVMDGLSARTGLPVVDPSRYGEGIGVDTESSIGFGISMGYAGGVERLAGCAASRVGDPGRVYVTGGDGEHLAGLLRMQVIYRPALVLEGLALAYSMLPASY